MTEKYLGFVYEKGLLKLRAELDGAGQKSLINSHSEQCGRRRDQREYDQSMEATASIALSRWNMTGMVSYSCTIPPANR